jgi:hypothetical protein
LEEWSWRGKLQLQTDERKTRLEELFWPDLKNSIVDMKHNRTNNSKFQEADADQEWLPGDGEPIGNNDGIQNVLFVH